MYYTLENLNVLTYRWEYLNSFRSYREAQEKLAWMKRIHPGWICRISCEDDLDEEF